MKYEAAVNCSIGGTKEGKEMQLVRVCRSSEDVSKFVAFVHSFISLAVIIAGNCALKTNCANGHVCDWFNGFLSIGRGTNMKWGSNSRSLGVI